MIRIEVEGRPAPKGSRIVGVAKDGRTYTRTASKFEKPWTDEIKRQAQIVMRHHPMPEPPYSVDLTFYIAGPGKNAKYDWPALTDIDKLARAALDGLVAGKVLKDDRHVSALTARKKWARARAPGMTALIDRSESVQLAA